MILRFNSPSDLNFYRGNHEFVVTLFDKNKKKPNKYKMNVLINTPPITKVVKKSIKRKPK